MNLKNRDFDINFVALNIGNHLFEYDLNNEFFNFLEYDFEDFTKCDISVKLDFEKKNNSMEMRFHLSGILELVCDLSGDKFDYKMDSHERIVIKFGQDFNDDDPEIIVIPQKEYKINIAKYLYEIVLFSIPMKRVSPKCLDENNDVLDIENEQIENKSEKTSLIWQKLLHLQNKV